MLKGRGLIAFIVSFLMLILVFGIPGTAAASDTVTIKAVPLYRCWNGTVHWYTTNQEERDGWLASGFNDEGIACYVSPAPLPYTVPLYKCMLYGDMYYATSSAERDAVISQYGFSYQGIEGYVIPANDTYYGDVNVNRWYHPESDHSDGWEWLSGETFVSSSEMDRHHFYQVPAGSIPGYNYEGVVFRAWDSPEVLQKIKVTAPNGKEALKAGDVVDINWNSYIDEGEMNLYYAMDGPSSNTLYKIEEELPNNGSYEWTVPNKAGSNVVIEARWLYYDNETDAWAYANDTSDSGFSITGSGGILKPGIIINPNLPLLKVFPAAPTGLTVTPYLSSRLDLYWKDNASNENGYVIERKTAGGSYAQIASVGANTTKYSDTSAAIGTTYYYRVKATGNFDSGYSNEASGTLFKFAVVPDIDFAKLIPGAPSGLAAAAVTNDPQAVKLTWQASKSDIGGYIIERKSGSGDWEMTSTVGADQTSVTESGLALNQSYSYRVRAYSLFLNSDPSNTVVFNTAASSGGSPGGTPGGSPGTAGQVDMDFFIGQASYNINGGATAMDVSPVIKESRTFLPIRFITEPIGAEIQWIDAEKKVVINQDSTIIELWIGKNNAEINGKTVPIDPDNASVMPMIINGRTMMPLRFIAENLGCEVKWIPENNQIKIHYQGNKLDPQPEPPMDQMDPQPEPPMDQLAPQLKPSIDLSPGLTFKPL